MQLPPPVSKTNSPLRSLRRPDSSKSHWKWLAGSAAVGGAVSTTAMAETVQILQIDNFFSSSTDSLKSDLTGDNTPDLPGLVGGLYRFSSYGVYVNYISAGSALKRIGRARYDTSVSIFGVGVGSAPGNTQSTAAVKVGLVSVVFTDSRINGGAETNGFIEVRAENENATQHNIAILRLIFDDADVAAPSDAAPMGIYPDWVEKATPTSTTVDSTAELAKLKRQLKALKKKLKKAKQSGAASKAIKLRKKIRKLKKALKAL